MTSLLRKLLTISVCTLLWAGAANANPVSIQGNTDPVNNTATMSWSVDGTGTELQIEIQNTCSFDCVVTGFQFSITDNVTGVTSLVSVSGTLDDGATGWSWTVTSVGCTGDNCVITGNNLNGGDPQDGIAQGATGTFTFGGGFDNPTTLDNITVRFQQTGEDGSNSDRGFVCTDPDPQTGSCEPGFPEPGTLALLGMGLLGLAASRRRRKVVA